MLSRHRKTLAVAVLGLFWCLIMAQGCDKNGADSRAKSAAAESTSAESMKREANDEGPAAGALPGERPPGSVQPKTLGPDAPAIFWLAGLKGYLEPCGCSADVLLGGIDRIVGYVQAATELYPDTVMVDAGDTFFEFAEIEEHAVPQEKAKAAVIVAAMRELETRFTVPGERDFALGTEFYLEKLEAADVEPIAANLKIDGKSLASKKTVQLGEDKVLFLPLVQPNLYEGIEGVEAAPIEDIDVESDLLGAMDGVDTVVLVMHGDLAATKNVLDSVDGIDFAIVGHNPRETDQVDKVGGGHTLEAYDQGRYVGILKLYHRENGQEWVNAGAGSESELEKVEKQVKHVKESINRFSPSQKRENPPMLARLRERLEGLESRMSELETSTVEVPEEGNAFIYRSVGMAPGFPLNEKLEEQRSEFNASLQKLASQVDREVVPAKESEAVYVGNNNCATCHGDAHDFWKDSQHAHAVKTLTDRDKLYDDSCIGCHVVGYEKPGGSVIGKLQYEAEVQGATVQKDLRNVGCESCHGPGSKHRVQPVGADGEPQHIRRDPAVDTCMNCHVPEHSPNFNFESYVQDITGEGHEMSTK